MKTMMLAAATVLSLGMGVAFADGGDGPAANSQFTLLPGVIAEAPTQSSSAFAQGPQAGQTTMSYVTESRTYNTWNPNEGVGG